MTAPVPRTRAAALSVAAGLLYALGHVGFGIWPLVFVCWLPWWRALDARSGPGAAGLGLAFGAAAYGLGYAWLWVGIEELVGARFGPTLALWCLQGAWFAGGFALSGFLFAVLRRRGAGAVHAGVVSLVVVEWLQPQVFASTAGEALVRALPLAQIAELGGPLLLSAFVAAVAGSLFTAWERARGSGAPVLRPGVAALALVALAGGYGAVRMGSLPAPGEGGERLEVGLVQSNLGRAEKRRASQAHRRHLEQTRSLLAEGPLDLVVWPETAYPRAIRRPLPVDGQPIRRDLDVPLLFGGNSLFELRGRRVSTNSAFLVGSDGRIHDVYDKNLLIPLAERPVVSGLGDAWGWGEQDFRAGATRPALRLGARSIATPICYEVTRSGFVRRMMRETGAGLIVTLANDGWFGDSREPRIHLALSRLRAVEHRRWLVRATNTGISAVVDPAGRVVARTGQGTRETLRASVETADGTTLYARVGAWPGPVALLGLFVGLVRRRSA